MKAIIVVITMLSIGMLVGCKSIPIELLSDLRPEDCRAYGVEVEDGRPVTGEIVRSEWGWSHDIDRECNPSRALIGQGHVSNTGNAETGVLQTSFNSAGNFSYGGCIKPAEGPPDSIKDWTWVSPTHRYEIWYSDNLCIPEHEACHVLYEEGMHTVRFDATTYQGHQFAACPGSRLKTKNRWPFKKLEEVVGS